MLKCGTEALAYLMEKEGKKIEANEIAEIIPDTDKGHSISDLIEIASSYGHELVGLQLSTSELNQIPLPAIMQITAKNDGDKGHYWVLDKVVNNTLELYDPQSRRRFTQSLDEFSNEWTGKALVSASKTTKSIPWTTLPANEKRESYGGCCGMPRPEEDLGDPDDDDDDDCAEGSPIWKINKINMNLYVTDIPLWYNPTIGSPVKIKLSYNSQSSIAYSEPFGNKWMFNYGSYIVEDPGETVTIFMPDGRRDVYTPDGLGGYTKPFEVFNTLTKIADNHFELEFLDGTVYVYNIPTGTSSLQPFLIEIRDAYNQKLTFGYNSNVQLTTITDALSKVTTLTYNANGLVERIDDPFGRSATFEYDANDNLTKVIDMGGYWTNYSYDTDVYLTGIENEKGRWDFYIEPADGISGAHGYPPPGGTMWENYRITITNPLGGKEEFYYYGPLGTDSWYVSPRDYVPYVDSNNNNYINAPKTAYSLTTIVNQRGKLNRIQYPEGGYVDFSYDISTGKPITITDFHSDSKQYTYNSNGLVTSFTDAEGNITTYDYYPNNIDVKEIKYDLSSTPEVDNIVLKSFTYNGSTHDIASITDALNNTTSITYNLYGQITLITEAQGAPVERTTELVYDPTTHELLEIKRDGNTLISFTYDNIGRVKTFTDATGLTLTYDYDNLDQITKITYPDTKFISINYSSCCPRLIDSITDRAGLTTNYTHDALKRLIQTQSPNGIINYEYDANGNLTKLTDADHKQTSFEYNLDNRLIKKIFPDSKFITYTHDLAGLLERITTSRNIEKYYTYDENHNLLSITYTDTTSDVTFTYDDYNRVETRTDGIGLYQYGYDANGRLTSIDSPWDNDTITFQYNELGQLTNLIPQGGQSITYTYDTIGRLTDIQSGANTYTYGYTGVNPLIQSLSRPNGSYTDYLYNDPLKRLTEIANKNSAQEIINKHVFTYNNLDVIGTETITTGTPLDSFTEGLKTYNYNNLNQLLSSTNPSQTFVYDDDGNMTQGYTPDGYQFTATYDAENRLTAITYNDGSINHEIKYYYSGDNMLAKVEKYQDGSPVSDTRFIRAGLLPLQERNGSNTITREYTWGINMGGGIGGLLNLKQNSQDYSYLYDGKGNVMSLIDSSESVVAAYRYDTFGVLKKEAGTLDQPYKFSTKQYDKLTGLSYYGYRFYNPTIGTWMTRDPLGELGGINLYKFAYNSPVNVLDPWGLWSISLEAYYGGGGGFVFGKNPGGGYFLTFRYGYGIGGGVSYNPQGTSPGWDPCENYGPVNVGVGGYGGASLGLGPAYLGISGNGGVNIGGAGHIQPYTGFGPEYGLDWGWSLRGGAAVGGEITFF